MHQYTKKWIYIAITAIIGSGWFSPTEAAKIAVADLDVGGFLQYDTGVSGLKEKDFGLRRFRTDIKGKLNPYVSYRTNLEYASGSASLLDAYVTIAIDKSQSLQIGKMKAPIGFELLQAPTDILFPEFGFTTYLVPNRDSGIQYVLKTSEWDVNLGVFSGASDFASIDGDSDTNRSFAGRFFVRPIREKSHVLGIGVGANLETKKGSLGTTGLTHYQYRGYGSLFKYKEDVYAEGTGYRIVPQATWIYGPLGVFGEYAVSSQEITNGTAKKTAQNKAWQVSVEYALTGETATYKEVKPITSFGDKDGVGAWIVAVRAGKLDIDDQVFAGFASTSQASDVQQLGASLRWVWDETTSWYLGIDQINRNNDNGTSGSDTLAVLRTQVIF